MDIGFLYALGAAVGWGFVYAINQKVLEVVSPIALVFLSACAALVILAPFAFFHAGLSWGMLVTGIRAHGWIILLSVAVAVIANFLILSAIARIGAATASIVEIAYPFFVVLFLFLLFRIVPNVYFFLGAILVLIGTAIIIKFSQETTPHYPLDAQERIGENY